MHTQKTRIWLGIGSYLLIGSAVAVAADGATPKPADTHAVHGKAGQGGEGGEGGEAGYTSNDPDQVYAVNLALMKGHLHMAKQLADQGAWDNAAAHAQHPAAETYGGVAPELKARKAEPFAAELNALVDQITEQQPAASLNAAYAAAVGKIDAAYLKIDAAKRGSAVFVKEVALALLRQSGAEYSIGVKESKIVNLHEYQDSSGFIAVADQMLVNLAQQTSAENAAVLQETSQELAALNGLWISAPQMGSAVAAAADILSRISRIELKLGKLR